MQCFETTTGYRASPNLKLFTMGEPPHVSRGQAISFTIASVMEAYHTPPAGAVRGKRRPCGAIWAPRSALSIGTMAGSVEKLPGAEEIRS